MRDKLSNLNNLQVLVGQPLKNVKKLFEGSKKTLRIVKENQAMTMEYRSDRINIVVNNKNIVTYVSEG
jgi:hypothetical protein